MADGVMPADAAGLDLLLRDWVGSSRTAEECVCVCSDGTDVLHDVSLMYDVRHVLGPLDGCVCGCFVGVLVNSACLLADDGCGDHRERQGRHEKV